MNVQSFIVNPPIVFRLLNGFIDVIDSLLNPFVVQGGGDRKLLAMLYQAVYVLFAVEPFVHDVTEQLYTHRFKSFEQVI